MTITIKPHELIEQLEREKFFGSLELIFKYGKVTMLKKTEHMITPEFREKRQNDRERY